MPGGSEDVRPQKALKRSLQLLAEAVDLLDAYGGPPEAAAHLELALERLRQALKQP